MRALWMALLMIAVGCLWLGACGDSDEETGSESSPPASSTRVALSKTPSLASSPEPDTSHAKIVFLRPLTSSGYGSLWMANLDGSESTELVPGDEASFVGVDQTSSLLVYYISKLASGSFRLRSRDSGTGEIRDFIDFAWNRQYVGPSGALSPDRRHIVFDHADGIDMVDLSTGRSNRLFTNESSGCNPPDVDLMRCESFSTPDWSPDGRWLTVSHGFYEGAQIEIVDSGSGSIVASVPGFNVSWSPGSQSICHTRSAGLDNGAFFVSAGPDWHSEQVLGLDNPNDSYEGCVWLDDSQAAFLVIGQYTDLPWRIGILEGGSRETRILSSGSGQPRPEGVFLTQGPGLIHNVIDTVDPASKKYGQPRLIDVISGSSAPFLDSGDVVVAVVH